ncbi:Cytochrome P450 - like 10 [Theobroma cacao]|nr:Cytochrome P450 - like 10 [Theobroma cacao]
MMTLLTYSGFLIIAVVLFLTFLTCSRKRRGLRWQWPVVAKLPQFVRSYCQFHDWSAQILERSGGTCLVVKNLWFVNMDNWLTSNPANVQHIMSKSFTKYPKGIDWRKRFDIFGDSVFNSDSVKWKYERALYKGFLNHQRFHELMPKIFEDSMEKQLIPILEHVSKQHVPVALQDLLGKHIFYFSCRMTTGCDLGLFQSSSHEHLFAKAIVNACEAISFRYLLPECIWKLQKWLGIGKEKRLSEARKTLDHLVSEYISIKRKELSSRLRKEDMDFSILKLLLDRDELAGTLSISDEVMRDNIITFMFAAHDTTSTVLSWFFWILSKHPVVEQRIREEIQKYLPDNGKTKWLALNAKELNKMVYLHAALCETLRLYPPVPVQTRTALHNDTLPSGHKINQGTRVSISVYAMGRMTSTWGEDCNEFKPERWITDDGGIKHEPAHKFFAFNAGPRSCLGKDFAFTLMKAITSAIIHNYDVQVVGNSQIAPKRSIILHMNHDLMVTVKKRWA